MAEPTVRAHRSRRRAHRDAWRTNAPLVRSDAIEYRLDRRCRRKERELAGLLAFCDRLYAGGGVRAQDGPMEARPSHPQVLVYDGRSLLTLAHRRGCWVDSDRAVPPS